MFTELLLCMPVLAAPARTCAMAETIFKSLLKPELKLEINLHGLEGGATCRANA